MKRSILLFNKHLMWPYRVDSPFNPQPPKKRCTTHWFSSCKGAETFPTSLRENGGFHQTSKYIHFGLPMQEGNDTTTMTSGFAKCVCLCEYVGATVCTSTHKTNYQPYSCTQTSADISSQRLSPPNLTQTIHPTMSLFWGQSLQCMEHYKKTTAKVNDPITLYTRTAYTSMPPCF